MKSLPGRLNREQGLTPWPANPHWRAPAPSAAAPFLNWTHEAVVGLWDVLVKYAYFRRKFYEMYEQIRRIQPAAVIFVDYPGFNLRLAAYLRRKGFTGKLIYYISPQVWAWNRGRIPRMAKLLDLMMCIFPFEKC